MSERPIRTGTWFNWQQPAKPLLLGGTVDACGEPFRQFFGFPFFTSIVYFRSLEQDRGYQASWLLRTDEGEACGRLLVDALSVPSFRTYFDTEIAAVFGALREIADEVSAENLETLDGEALVKRFEEFHCRFVDFYRIGAVTEPVQWHVERVFREFVAEAEGTDLVPEGWSSDRLEAAAFMTTEESYTLEIERSLEAVAEAFQTGDGATGEIEEMSEERWQELWQRSPALWDSASAHAADYYWKTNNYRETKVVDPAEVVLEVARMKDGHEPVAKLASIITETEKRRKAMTQDRAELLPRCPAPIRTLLTIGDRYGASLADKRKALMLRALHGIDLLGREVSRRSGIGHEFVLNLTPSEVRGFLADPETYRLRLEQRNEALVLVASPFPLDDAEMTARLRIQSSGTKHGLPRKDDISLAEGQAGIELLDRLDATMGLFEDSLSETVRGSVIVKPSVQPTLIEGRCRVITDPRVDRLEPGEILIATSTTPDFMPAIRDASALLVDQGGVLSHAALTSRELGKPCIVGASYATSVFRTGDLIQLDFDEGMARFAGNGSHRAE